MVEPGTSVASLARTGVDETIRVYAPESFETSFYTTLVATQISGFACFSQVSTRGILDWHIVAHMAGPMDWTDCLLFSPADPDSDTYS